jgi:hypothetical protein
MQGICVKIESQKSQREGRQAESAAPLSGLLFLGESPRSNLHGAVASSDRNSSMKVGYQLVRILNTVKPAIDVLKAPPSRAFKTSVLDFK